LWILVGIFCVNGIWVLTQVEEQVQTNTREIPHEDILADFGDVLGLWADEQKMVDIERLDIDCNIDDLLIETRNNKGNEQAFQTITLTVNLYIDAESYMDYAYIDYRNVASDLDKALGQSPYEKFIRERIVNYYRAEDSAFLNSDSISITSSSKTAYVKQERNEKKTQTIAYNFADKLGYETFDDGTGAMRQYGFALLNRFGVLKDSYSLHVEIKITSDHGEHREAFWGSLGTHADKLHEELTSNKTAEKYMEERGVKTISIVFYAPWDAEEQYRTYMYEV
ncbi:MAG: hypothetical protein J5972_01060, partial [Eubacterium sp.]|nr:hypothetical protein [Eubacterium sp.]